MNSDYIMVVAKFSIAISALTVFYKLFLEKLTFFRSARWYFIIGILSSVLIALVTIELPSVSMTETAADYNRIAEYIPSLYEYSKNIEAPDSGHLSMTSILVIFYTIGFIALILRFGIQLFSFHRIRKTAKKVENGVKGNIYITKEYITPFSFGNSIFVSNSNLDLASLEKIIAHEMIHIKQYHTLDMLLAELVCILNWFNPFSWVLKKSIRQNLEYLADDIMLSRGTDIKAYQYLLLQTLGHSPYSLASAFNFHSLKSRIMMMNQNKSHYLQKLKFLLLLPIGLLLLFAFRSLPDKVDSVFLVSESVRPDTIKPRITPDEASIKMTHDKNGNMDKAVVKYKNGETESYNMKDEKENKEFFEKFDMPPPPPPPHQNSESNQTISYTYTPDKDDKIKRISIRGNRKDGDIATVYLQDGTKEVYNLNNKAAKEDFEEKYSHLLPEIPSMPPMPPMPPMAPMPPMPPMAPMTPMDPMAPAAPLAPMPPITPIAPMPPMPPAPPLFEFELPENATDMNINDKEATIKFKDGSVEKYDLNNAEERKAFRKKFRRVSNED